jgi:UDP-N-acetylglucosamine 2-epimerase
MKSAPCTARCASSPGVELTLVHTGQHYDDAMSDVFFRELGMPRPDEFLGVGPGTHGEQTAKALIGIERVLIDREIDLCVVAGDVNSTLAGALAAVKLGIPIAHIEAGLRSFDRAMPEEHNRVLTDHVSDILLAHSEEAITNLQREGITSGVHLVGNTMIDSLLEHLDTARARRSWEQFGLTAEGYALVTLHRPALVDDPGQLARRRRTADRARRESPVLFPVHPRTLRNLEAARRRRACREAARARPSRSATSTSSASRQTPPSCSPTPAASRRRRRRSACPLLHAPRLDRAAGHGRARHEHRPRCEGRSGSRDSRAAERRAPAHEIPKWDGAAGPRAAETLQRALR